ISPQSQARKLAAPVSILCTSSVCTKNREWPRRCTELFERPVSWPLRQFLTRQAGFLRRFVTAAAVVAFFATAALVAGCRSSQQTTASSNASKNVPQRGEIG